MLEHALYSLLHGRQGSFVIRHSWCWRVWHRRGRRPLNLNQSWRCWLSELGVYTTWRRCPTWIVSMWSLISVIPFKTSPQQKKKLLGKYSQRLLRHSQIRPISQVPRVLAGDSKGRKYYLFLKVQTVVLILHTKQYQTEAWKCCVITEKESGRHSERDRHEHSIMEDGHNDHHQFEVFTLFT